MKFIESRMEQRGQSGFTLIELLVVIAILAVLGGAAIIGIGAMRDNAEEQACKTDADTLKTAAHAWLIDQTLPLGAAIANDDGSSLGSYIEEPATSAARVSIAVDGTVTTNEATAC